MPDTFCPSCHHLPFRAAVCLFQVPSALPVSCPQPSLTPQETHTGVLQECGLGDIEWQHFGSAPPASALCCCLPPPAALQPSRGVCERVHPAGVLPHSQ